MPLKQITFLRRQAVESTAQQCGASPVGEESEVAYADEARRQKVEQEAAQELIAGQSHEPLLVAVGGVSPAEGDVARGESNQPAVGDGDAMGVCAEIAQHMLWSTKRPLGVDNPVVTKQHSQPSSEGTRFGEWEKAAVELELAR